MLSLTMLEDHDKKFNAYNEQFGLKKHKNVRSHLVDDYKKIKEWR